MFHAAELFEQLSAQRVGPQRQQKLAVHINSFERRSAAVHINSFEWRSAAVHINSFEWRSTTATLSTASRPMPTQERVARLRRRINVARTGPPLHGEHPVTRRAQVKVSSGTTCAGIQRHSSYELKVSPSTEYCVEFQGRSFSTT